ncbi:MAG TPA: trigger factor [Candidatus Paceibacterota bacterium]|nr:trigger factor [Candidatus Paceibacterota bacterium]
MPAADIAKSFTRKDLPGSEVELSGDIPYEAIASFREAALRQLAGQLEMPGFRPGKVPTDIALKKIGEVGVMEEAIEMYMQELYPALLEAHKVDAVGRPDIRITKLAPNNPVSFTIRAAVYPTVTLPKDWKKAHEKIALEPAAPATEEEVEKTLESLRQNRAVREEGKEPVLPEVTDEWAKTLGAFENVAALKEQIKKGIDEEKARAAKDARRGKIIDTIIAGTTVDVPKVFIESEQDKIISQMREDITRMGLTFEDYLKHINKTEDAVREEFRDQARKRATLQLVLNKVAQEEGIKADEPSVEAEMHHALQHFPDANPELLRIHIETVLRNELTLRRLEGDETPLEPSSHDHDHSSDIVE